MKAKHLVSILVVTALLTGCADFERPALDAGLGAGGGFLGSELSNGNPAITAAGAVGGIVAGEGINAFSSNARKNAYSDGYQHGRSDAVKNTYWNQVDAQKSPSNER